MAGVRLARLAASAVVLAWSLGPVLWFASLSLKSPAELAARPPRFLPRRPQAGSYERLATEHRFGTPLRNSVLVAGATTVLTVPLAALAAYGLTRGRFRGRGGLLGLVLATSMFPPVAVAYGLERWLFGLGWVGTHHGLVVPYVSLALPLATWVLALFFREIPGELEEAARLDGCRPARALARVFFPVAAPAVAATAILTFLHAWNELFFASFLADRESVRTVPVAIAQLQGRFWLPWGEVAAASVLSTAPLVALVLLLQRRIAHGLSAGAVKG